MKKAGIATAVVTVVGAGAASALFVDYLADRARERIAAAPTRPEVVTASIDAGAAAAEKPAKILQATAGQSSPAPLKAAPVRSPDKRWFAAEASGAPTVSADPFRAIVPSAADELDLSAYAAEDADNPSSGSVTSSLDDSQVPVPTAKPSVAADDAGEGAAPLEVASAAPDESLEAGGKPGKIARSVTMRASPRKGGKPIGTVPAKSSVTLFSCSAWCEISFNGKRGFVYKSFVD